MKPKGQHAVAAKKLIGLTARQMWLLTWAFIVTISILGGVYLHFAWSRYYESSVAEAIVLAQTAEALLHPEHVAALTGNLEDIGKPAYTMMKLSLMRLVEINNPIRFAYLMGKRDDNIIFLMDSEPESSPDYSPPGQIYSEATEADHAIYQTGQSVFTNPVTDRWGTWISVMVPVKDSQTGEVLAVFGVDYSASEWYANLYRRMIPDIVVVLCILILAVALVRVYAEHHRLKMRSKKLSTDEALFRSVFDQAPIGIAIVTDKSFAYPSNDGAMNINRTFEKIIGRSKEELAGVNWPDITYPDDLQADLLQFARFQKGEIEGYSIEKRFIRPDGSIVWTNMIIASLLSRANPELIHLCLLEDISARKQIEEAFQESERSKAVLLSHIPGMAYRCQYDRDWTMEFVSEGCVALTGYSAESLINNHEVSFNELILPEYRERLWQEWEQILPQKRNFRYEYEISTKSGEHKWVLELAQGVYTREGNVSVLEGIIIDISEQKKREAQILYLSEHDFLTGLYNRRYLEKQKKRYDQSEHWPLSIVICDINGVRMVNNAFGQAEGDRLIIDVAQMIQSCCRDEDVLSRTGGNEFTLLMPRTTYEQARHRVQQLVHAVESLKRAEQTHPYEISLSAGYNTKVTADQSIDQLIRSAEESLINRKLLNRKSSHNAILSSIMATLYARSQETEEHGHRLATLTHAIGERLHLDQKVLDDLELLSMLHDIGKVGIDDRVLNKPGKLTLEERRQMEKHSEIGHRIALSTPELEHIADYILFHHEWWDGTGYPTGLAGEAIPLPSRILAVADAYDAMVSDRVYRNALSKDTAIAEIESFAGKQFDPAIARLFVALMKETDDLSLKQ